MYPHSLPKHTPGLRGRKKRKTFQTCSPVISENSVFRIQLLPLQYPKPLTRVPRWQSATRASRARLVSPSLWSTAPVQRVGAWASRDPV
jgi:hypothetical protein